MKITFLYLLSMMAASCIFHSSIVAAQETNIEYSSKIKFVLAQLKEERDEKGIPLITGRSFGYEGKHGAFFILYPYIQDWATVDDLKKMERDANPIARIIAAKRLLGPANPEYKTNILDVLKNDHARVRIGPLIPTGKFTIMTVAEVVSIIAKDEEFLMADFDFDSVSQKKKEVSPTK